MEKESKPKKRFFKVWLIVLIVLGVLLAIIAVFYFYPAPNFSKKVLGKIERCFYKNGIGYHDMYSGEDGGTAFYNHKGEFICYGNTWNSKLPKESPCLSKTCFPIYDNNLI